MSELSLKSLRAIDAVARKGSLSSAAAEIGIAQSAISRHLQEAETCLGGTLFHRNGRGATLTSHGKAVWEHVQQVLEQLEALQARAHASVEHPSGLVTLGLVPGVSAHCAVHLFREIRVRYPKIRLRIKEGYSGEMEQALIDGEVDIAVINRYRTLGRSYHRVLHRSPLCVVARPEVLARISPSSPGSGRRKRSCSPSVLADLPLVAPAPPNAMLNVLEEYARANDLTIDIAMESSSPMVLRHLLLHHDCASVMPRHALLDDVKDGRLDALALKGRSFIQHIVLASSPRRHFTDADRAVASLLEGISGWLD